MLVRLRKRNPCDLARRASAGAEHAHPARMAERFPSFAAFWPHYLREHARPATRVRACRRHLGRGGAAARRDPGRALVAGAARARGRLWLRLDLASADRAEPAGDLHLPRPGRCAATSGSPGWRRPGGSAPSSAGTGCKADKSPANGGKPGEAVAASQQRCQGFAVSRAPECPGRETQHRPTTSTPTSPGVWPGRDPPMLDKPIVSLFSHVKPGDTALAHRWAARLLPLPRPRHGRRDRRPGDRAAGQGQHARRRPAPAGTSTWREFHIVLMLKGWAKFMYEDQETLVGGRRLRAPAPGHHATTCSTTRRTWNTWKWSRPADFRHRGRRGRRRGAGADALEAGLIPEQITQSATGRSIIPRDAGQARIQNSASRSSSVICVSGSRLPASIHSATSGQARIVCRHRPRRRRRASRRRFGSG